MKIMYYVQLPFPEPQKNTYVFYAVVNSQQSLNSSPWFKDHPLGCIFQHERQHCLPQGGNSSPTGKFLPLWRHSCCLGSWFLAHWGPSGIFHCSFTPILVLLFPLSVYPLLNLRPAPFVYAPPLIWHLKMLEIYDSLFINSFFISFGLKSAYWLLLTAELNYSVVTGFYWMHLVNLLLALLGNIFVNLAQPFAFLAWHPGLIIVSL